jgi:hypothetical protein
MYADRSKGVDIMGNGTVTFFTDPSQAAAQVVADVSSFQSQQAQLAGGLGVAPILIAGAVGSLISASAGVTNAAVGLANLATKNAAGSDALEIEFSNSSSQPVVIFDYDPKNSNVTKVPEPLAAGETDIFLLTNPSGIKTGAQIEIDFMVGPIACSVTYQYTDTGNPGRWQVSLTIDGNSQTFPNNLQLLGATFQGNTGFSSFSIYTSPIETSSGQMDLSIYDLATSTAAVRSAAT